MMDVMVWARDRTLRQALEEAITWFAPVRPVEEFPPRSRTGASIVVVPAGDCPLDVCRELSGSHWRVVVLAAIPREPERTAYLQAGATGYVPMTVGLDALCEAITQAAVAA